MEILFSLISWNHQEPKYDLRRWRSGKPLKGMSLAEDTLKAICEAIGKITIEVPKKEERENSQDKTEDAEKPSVKKNILSEKVLSFVSKHEYAESQLRIEDVIGEQALVYYLLRNNISTLSDLAKGIYDGS